MSGTVGLFRIQGSKLKKSKLCAAACGLGLSMFGGLPSLAETPQPPTLQVKSPNNESALLLLRQLRANPAVRESLNARKDALLTTGSVINVGGDKRVLHHLPAIGRDLRLTGEIDSLEWPVYFAPQQLQGNITLHLGLLNAVSVMPEASQVTVELNGVEIAKRALQSADRTKVVKLTIPSNILVPGYNSLKVKTRQRHRVDCSIPATNELWTEIDPSQTGFVFDSTTVLSNSQQSLSSLPRNKAGQVNIRLLTDQPTNKAALQNLIYLTQHLAVHSQFMSSTVEVGPDLGRGAGLDIFIGSAMELRERYPAYAAMLQNGVGLQLLSEPDSDRKALVFLTGEVSGQLDNQYFVDQLVSWFGPQNLQGSHQGLNAKTRLLPSMIAEGEPAELDQFGVESIEFDGRRFSRKFQISLPGDFYPADYASAKLKLKLGYAAGLAPSNQFLVRVNGSTLTGFSLHKEEGEVLDGKSIQLPLSSFTPGQNQIELEAITAHASDADCDPRLQISSPPRLVFSGSSSIEFPKLARIASIPNLASTMASGFPYVVNGQPVPTTVNVLDPNYTSLSAAANLVTQMAVRAGKPLDFKLHFGRPDLSTKNAVLIGGFGVLPNEISENIDGIDASSFQSAWLENNRDQMTRQIALRQVDETDFSGLDLTMTASIPTTDENPQKIEPPKSADERLPNVSHSWGEEALRSLQINHPQSQVVQQENSVADWISDLAESAFELHKAPASDQLLNSQNHSGLLIAQQSAPGVDGGVWTIFSASSDQNLKLGAEALVRAHLRHQVYGGAAVFGAVDETITSAITPQSYVQFQPFSWSNTHLIIAGWFSNNYLIYGLLFVFSLFGFGLISNRLLQTVGADASLEELRKDE